MLLLDYLIVIALAALFVPHYLGAARLGRAERVAVGRRRRRVAIAALAVVRLVRRPQLYLLAVGVAGVALSAHGC